MGPRPNSAHLGPMTIRYYSTCWMIGLLLGDPLMSKLYKQQGLSDEKFSPLFLYIFLGVLIGGRLGHCIFYQPEYFLTRVGSLHRDADTYPSHARWQLEVYGL